MSWDQMTFTSEAKSWSLCLEETHYRDTLHPDFIGTVQNKDFFFFFYLPHESPHFLKKGGSQSQLCVVNLSSSGQNGDGNKENFLWWLKPFLNPRPMKSISCIHLRSLWFILKMFCWPCRNVCPRLVWTSGDFFTDAYMHLSGRASVVLPWEWSSYE